MWSVIDNSILLPFQTDKAPQSTQPSSRQLQGPIHIEF